MTANIMWEVCEALLICSLIYLIDVRDGISVVHGLSYDEVTDMVDYLCTF